MTFEELVKRVVKQSVTRGQWETAEYVLRCNGHLSGSNEDIPKIVQEVQDNIVLRHKYAILESIYGALKGDIFKEAVRGIGKWYKEKLEKDGSNDDIDIGTPAVA